MARSDEYIIDTIFPRKEVHLLAGPTGAGKTRWLFDTILDWQAGRSVHGYQSYPCPWVYVSADRREASVYRTLETMGINPKSIPLVAALDRRLTQTQIFDEILKAKAQLAVIESFGSFVGHPGGKDQVRSLFKSLQKLLDENLTILGVMESPKMKPKEQYDNPRQRVSGVATWGHYAETIVLIEPANPDEVSSPRNITICPRNAAEIVIQATFDGGRLRPLPVSPFSRV